MTLPDEVPKPDEQQLANFSFDTRDRKLVPKTDVLTGQFLEFMTESETYLVQFSLEDKLGDIFTIIEEQEKIKESQVVKNSDSRFGSSKGLGSQLVKDRLNVFKESLTHNLSGSWNNSLVKQMNSGKMEETSGSVIQVINELAKHEPPAEFQETSSFNSEPKRLEIKPEVHNPKPEISTSGQEIDKRTISYVKVKFTFKKEKAKDLALKKGDIVEVVKMSQNGWWLGKNLSTGEQGYFPLNFVEVIE